ncbi:MAG: hypothetical protein BJ554DRAFT_5020 [Olpidium bornovanus]|uniref:Uncharacterized protein n=1 Tax=Olpidium bornovanus TaxID=278681 RepID=A0A8H7ZK89_9FUNG|nr:MAG: hypothetical protein BJ554DRAFT_5020 [Olpidium bornovanus]
MQPEANTANLVEDGATLAGDPQGLLSPIAAEEEYSSPTSLFATDDYFSVTSPTDHPRHQYDGRTPLVVTLGEWKRRLATASSGAGGGPNFGHRQDLYAKTEEFVSKSVPSSQVARGRRDLASNRSAAVQRSGVAVCPIGSVDGTGGSPVFANSETPFIDISGSTVLCLSEEVHEGSKGGDVWRGTVNSLRDPAEAQRMESAAPAWLLAYLLEDKIPPRDIVKIAFVLKPDDSPGRLPLADLPAGQNRLTANRMLRVRKVIAYVVEKLDLVAPPNQNSTAAEGTESPANQAGSVVTGSPTLPTTPFLPEEWIELLCNGQVRRQSRARRSYPQQLAGR